MNGTTSACGCGIQKPQETLLRVARIKTIMPKNKINNGWTRTEIKHKGIHNWCCLDLQKGIGNWFTYNPKTLKLALYESDYDQWGDLESEEYFDMNYCPFCGTKIKVELIEDIVKTGILRQEIVEKPSIIKVVKSEKIEWTEKDLMKK